jgi:hypothetical protein
MWIISLIGMILEIILIFGLCFVIVTPEKTRYSVSFEKTNDFDASGHGVTNQNRRIDSL